MYFFRCFVFLLIPSCILSQLKGVEENWQKEQGLKHATLSYCVIDLKTAQVIASLHPHQALFPASTLKVLTTAAALSTLGKDFRYETKLYFSGNFDKHSGILDGDLIVLGSGDPTLQSENFYPDSVQLVSQWAKRLKEFGLKEITGNIIADASCFERKVPDNWIWEDINNYYAAIPNGVSYRDNKVKLTYSTREKQSEAILTSMNPSYFTQTLTVHSEVIAGGTTDEAYAYGDPFSFTKEVKGTLPANKTNYEVELALPDPALLCAEQVYSALQQCGIKCQAKNIRSRYLKTPLASNSQLVYTHRSPTLDKIVYFTNQTSNNHYCESLLYTLGAGNAENGLLKVRSFWKEQGLDTSELYMEDASGLGRINTLCTELQCQALYKISLNTTLISSFKASLPLAGKQGSMSSLGKGSFIENKLRAKTGYMKRVRAYCGYVTSRSGKELAFSLIFNHYSCSAVEAKKQMEKFLIALGEL